MRTIMRPPPPQACLWGLKPCALGARCHWGRPPLPPGARALGAPRGCPRAAWARGPACRPLPRDAHAHVPGGLERARQLPHKHQGGDGCKRKRTRIHACVPMPHVVVMAYTVCAVDPHTHTHNAHASSGACVCAHLAQVPHVRGDARVACARPRGPFPQLAGGAGLVGRGPGGRVPQGQQAGGAEARGSGRALCGGGAGRCARGGRGAVQGGGRGGGQDSDAAAARMHQCLLCAHMWPVT